MDETLQDLRYALRQLKRSPVFVVTTVLCVAIGIGANTTIFSLFNALLLRPVPGIRHSERLLEVGRKGTEGADTLPWPTWRDLKDQAEAVDLAFFVFSSVAVSRAEEPRVLLGFSVTADYFDVLGLEPSAGGFFTSSETSVENPRPLAVLSHHLWTTHFGADPGTVGGTIRVNGTPVTVVGIGPEGFRGHLSVVPADVWVPLGLEAPGLPSRATLEGARNHFLLGVGRLKGDNTAESAAAELNLLLDNMVLHRPFLEQTEIVALTLKTLPTFVHVLVRLFVLVLLSVVSLVLLIACINVAGMLLVRTTARAREFAVRQALGAGRGRILRQLLTETLILFSLGGIVGVLASLWATRILAAMSPPTPPPFVFNLDLALDYRVLFFSVALTLATGLLFGLGPALRASGTSLVPSLKEERTSMGLRKARTRALLIATQMALTLLLLVGSGLFLKALGRAQSIDPGFDPADVEVVSFDLQLHGYGDDDGRRFYSELQERVATLPGVSGAGLTLRLPLGMPTTTSFGGLNVEGFEPPAGDSSYPAPVNVVSPGYFSALGLPLLAGRDFTPADGPADTPVAIINESTARHFFGDSGAVGRTVFEGPLEQATALQIIGVVADAKYTSLQEEGTFFYYLPLAQRYNSTMALLVRGRSGAFPPRAMIRGVVDQLDSDIPFLDVVALEDYVAITYLPQRVAGLVSGLLGGVGLLLGAVGIAGVAAFMTQQRFQEMGIRMALGAGRSDLTRLFVRQGMGAPLVGSMIGLLLALGLTRFLASFLFGVSPLDPVTIAIVSGLLLAVALLANWVPTRRAVQRDPLKMLKYE